MECDSFVTNSLRFLERAENPLMKLTIKYFENQQLVAMADLDATLELGRQRQGEPTPDHQSSNLQSGRLIIAGRSETNVSRRHLILNRNDDGGVSVDNLNKHMPIQVRYLRNMASSGDHEELEDADEQTQTLIPPGGSMHFTPPVLLLMDDKVIRVEYATENPIYLSGLESPTLPPGFSKKTIEPFHTLFASSDDGRERESVLNWLHTAMGVFQQAASSPEFFTDAARAVVDIVDLDAAGILFRSKEGWQSKAIAFSQSADEASWRPSQTILNKVVVENRVFRQIPETNDGQESLRDVVAVVAAPILSAEGTVIGVIYGDRRQQAHAKVDVEISLLEAKLVELLASAVAAGLARLAQEQAAVAARAQFEQFFSPELAQELEVNAGLLEGRDTEVTLLFMDIRGFSRITEKLGPSSTVEWINDVLGRLSECVFAESGVLVEYIGDELFAMWGAPTPCDDQSQRACRAALRMLEAVPELEARWKQLTGESLRIGIGVNTGIARVGNVGSRHRFKYGPLGNAVNLASRIEGATKYLGRPLLISGSTAQQLDASFATRRLCTIRVKNIQEPVDIFDLAPQANPPWRKFQSQYELALQHFEKSDFTTAVKILAVLVAEHPDDEPSLLLLSRTVEMISKHHMGGFDPVWELPGK